MRAIITVVGEDKVGIIAAAERPACREKREHPGYQPDNYAGYVYYDNAGGYRFRALAASFQSSLAA